MTIAQEWTEEMLRAALGSKNLNQGQYHEGQEKTPGQRWALLVRHINERCITAAQVLYQCHMDLISDCQGDFEQKCFEFFCQNILPGLREIDKRKEDNVRASQLEAKRKKCQDAAKSGQPCISEEEILRLFAEENPVPDFKTDQQMFDSKKIREKQAVQDKDCVKKEQVEFTSNHDDPGHFLTCFDTVRNPIELKCFYSVDSASKISRKLLQYKSMKENCGPSSFPDFDVGDQTFRIDSRGFAYRLPNEEVPIREIVCNNMSTAAKKYILMAFSTDSRLFTAPL